MMANKLVCAKDLDEGKSIARNGKKDVQWLLN